YFLLTGKAPFDAPALLRLAAGVVTQPEPLSQLRPDVPRELTAIVEGMLAVDRDQRYQKASAVAADLKEWLMEVAPPPLCEPRSPPPIRVAVMPPEEEPLLPEIVPEAAVGASGWAVAALAAGMATLAFVGFLVFRLM